MLNQDFMIPKSGNRFSAKIMHDETYITTTLVPTLTRS